MVELPQEGMDLAAQEAARQSHAHGAGDLAGGVLDTVGDAVSDGAEGLLEGVGDAVSSAGSAIVEGAGDVIGGILGALFD